MKNMKGRSYGQSSLGYDDVTGWSYRGNGAIFTTQLQAVELEAEHALSIEDPEFAMTGLHRPSRIRLYRLAALEGRLIRRRLGRIGPRTRRGVERALRHIFDL